MQFDRAMALLFAGHKVQRLAWVRPDKNTHLKLATADGNHLVVMEGVEIVFTRSVPFTKTCGVHGADMAADDWEVVPGDIPPPAPNAVTAGQGVEVKPLEWSENLVGNIWSAGCSLTRYYIAWSKFDALYHPRIHYVGDEYLKPCSTLEDAKAAAQADYDQRILSALTTPTPKEESK
jgi:hypothetical protein